MQVDGVKPNQNKTFKIIGLEVPRESNGCLMNMRTGDMYVSPSYSY